MALDRMYSDIVGFAYYVGPSYISYANNMSVYLSPTEYFQNGITCASNAAFASTGTTPNSINCTQTISNANYVTLVKAALSTGNDHLFLYEFQILRAGMQPVHVSCVHSPLGLAAASPSLFPTTCPPPHLPAHPTAYPSALWLNTQEPLNKRWPLPPSACIVLGGRCSGGSAGSWDGL